MTWLWQKRFGSIVKRQFRGDQDYRMHACFLHSERINFKWTQLIRSIMVYCDSNKMQRDAIWLPVLVRATFACRGAANWAVGTSCIWLFLLFAIIFPLLAGCGIVLFWPFSVKTWDADWLELSVFGSSCTAPLALTSSTVAWTGSGTDRAAALFSCKFDHLETLLLAESGAYIQKHKSILMYSFKYHVFHLQGCDT